MFRVSLAAGRAAGMRSALRPTASPALLRPSGPLLLRPQAVRGPLSLRMMSTATVPPAVADAAAVQARRNKIMGGWLMTTSGLVFGIVVVGGLTRLTESGLSITDWRPVKGSIPPLTQEDWEVEFAKYKKSPEYIIENDGMTLDEFKKIFWMEWGHRQLGRFIGLAYVGPFAFFAARGWLRGRMLAATTGIGALIGVQGLIGWLMVKSGLEQKIIEDGEVPRVSHYRLAAHLGTAFAIYMASLWNGLTLLANYGNDYKLPHTAPELTSLRRFRKASLALTGAVFFTAMSGALVAGLDAGLIYNEFPKMGNGLVPEDLLTQKPTWRNFIDNPSAVQFDHRYLGLGTASLVTGVWAASTRVPLSRKSRVYMNMLAGMVGLQVMLGISTLLSHVEIKLASAHQTGAMVLLTLSTHLVHSLRNMPK